MKKPTARKPFFSPPQPSHREPPHHDTDPITASKFPFAELIPNWSNMDPHTKNPATGSVFSSSHHGAGGRAKSMRDFKRFNVACCLEWVDKQVGGRGADKKTKRVRCMNVFTVESAQCTVHRKALCKDGPNKVYQMMRKGREACWGDLRDRE